jgi:hypothetical protein
VKATCPADPSHNRFITVAHITEDWVVNEHGEFITEGGPGAGEVVALPHPENTWTCVVCGAEANVDS